MGLMCAYAHTTPSDRSIWQFRRPRLHAVTWIAMSLLGVVLLAANIHGQVATEWESEVSLLGDSEYDQPADFIWTSNYRGCWEHGWPLTFAERNGVGPDGKAQSPWKLDQEIHRFDVPPLVADAVIGLAVMALGGALVETWRRRRAKVYQFHILDLFILSGAVASGLGAYTYYRSHHQAEAEALEAIAAFEEGPESTWRSTRAVWAPVAWRWFDEAKSTWHQRSVFHRVVGLQCDGAIVSQEVAKLRSLRGLSLDNVELASIGELAALDELPRLEALGLSNLRFKSEVQAHFPGPRLTKLRKLLCDVRQFLWIGPENLRSLNALFLYVTHAEDEVLPKLRAMPRLKSLTLYGTTMSSDRMAHLAGLSQLEELYIEGPSDEGVRQLVGLANLRRLVIVGGAVTDDSMPVFRRLANLEYLKVIGGSEALRQKLRDALPACDVW